MDSNDDAVETRAAQRLRAPGVIDRAPAQQLGARLQRAATGYGLTDRLLRRALPGPEATQPALAWRRAAPAGGADEGTATWPVAPATAMPSVDRVQAPLLSRRAAPGASTTVPGVPGTRAVDHPPRGRQAPRLADSDSAALAIGNPVSMQRPSLQASPGLPMPPSSPTPLVQRQAADAPPAAPRAASRSPDGGTPHPSPATRTGTGLASVTRPPSFAATGSVPLVVARRAATPVDRLAAAASPAIGTAKAGPGPAATPLSSARPIAAPAAPAAAELTLQRSVDVTARAARAGPVAFATSAAPPADELARDATAAAPDEPGAAPLPSLAPEAPADIDWIAEQVGRRLQRRQEIERDRKGNRTWR